MVTESNQRDDPAAPGILPIIRVNSVGVEDNGAAQGADNISTHGAHHDESSSCLRLQREPTHPPITPNGFARTPIAPRKIVYTQA